MTPSPRLATYFHVHLVSDATGETLNAMTKAVCARFEEVLPIEHIYPLMRSARQLERVLKEVESAPGMVVHTIVDRDLRAALEEGCRELGAPCIGALDNDYFNRIEALNYAIGHDDGQGGRDLESADVVLVGVSRTSKTPTCIYLAHRGVRAANVPLAPGIEPPDKLFTLKTPLIVGLLVSPERLIQIRRNRLLSINETGAKGYVEQDAVRQEIIRARRLFEKHDWPVIDVSRRSVEETAAQVMTLLNARRIHSFAAPAPTRSSSLSSPEEDAPA